MLEIHSASTAGLIHFKPMFHFNTPYTPCKNHKTFKISDALLGWVGVRYGNEALAWNGLIT